MPRLKGVCRWHAPMRRSQACMQTILQVLPVGIASTKPSSQPALRRSPALLASQSLPALEVPGPGQGGCFGSREFLSAIRPTFPTDAQLGCAPPSEGRCRKALGLHPIPALQAGTEPPRVREAHPNGGPSPRRVGRSPFSPKENAMYAALAAGEPRRIPVLLGGSGLTRPAPLPQPRLAVLLRPLPCLGKCGGRPCADCREAA